jgi:hypothetical protein
MGSGVVIGAIALIFGGLLFHVVDYHRRLSRVRAHATVFSASAIKSRRILSWSEP